MASFVPIYPYSCAPNDMMLATESMHDRFFFTDVHIRGHYPNYILKNGNEMAFMLQWKQVTKPF